MAGITVGVFLVPQSMAYAVIANLPPIYGLYASTVAGFVYALFGTSGQLSIGAVVLVGTWVRVRRNDDNGRRPHHLAIGPWSHMIAANVTGVALYVGGLRQHGRAPRQQGQGPRAQRAGPLPHLRPLPDGGGGLTGGGGESDV